MTARAVFTDKFLEKLKPAAPGKRAVYWDGKLANFGVRVTDSGIVSFIAMRRAAGQKNPVRITLGRYPQLKLADARKKAGSALSDLAEGNDPRERQAVEIAERARKDANTVAHIASRFLDEHIEDTRTARAIRQLVESKIVAAWGPRPIASITKADMLKLIADVRADVRKRRGTPGTEQARQVLIYLKSMWAWAAENDLIEANPAAAIKLSGKRAKALPAKRSRERVLTDAEIASLWRATEGEDFPTNPFLRLLLILGVRRSELSDMTRDELDLDAGLWRLSGDRTKNEDPRVIPLPRMAVEIFRGLPEFKGPFVFTTTSGARPISGFAKMKARLDKQCKIAPWRLHDLRRTMRTNLSALRVPHLIAELAIGHKQQGVHAVYDLHKYESEIRDALDQWCARLRDITAPAPDNVRRLRA